MSKKYKEGVHFYYENGLVILTEKFHLERGRCCHNDCRHCPYDKDNGNQKTRNEVCKIKKQTNDSKT